MGNRVMRRAGLLAVAVAMLPVAVFAAPTTETPAKFALLIDANSKAVLLEKNADAPMHPSSMSKLMTSYLLFERLKQGRIKLDDMLPVSENAWRKQGSKMFVDINSRAKVEDLIKGIVVQSGNDACIVVAEALSGSEEQFAEEMTKRGREIGLKNSNFRNATGWPDPEHMMTPRDLATLAERLISDYPEYYRYYSQTEFTFNGIKQGNRNPLLYKNMGADGLKTGHTEAAGYGLTASAVRQGRRLILVVNGLGSMNERAREAERLIEWGFREFGNYEIAKSGVVLDEAPVWLGEQEKVPVTVADTVSVTTDRQARREMRVMTSYDGPIAAPIKKGDRVGTLRVVAPGWPEVQKPLVAAADVEQLGLFGRIGAAIAHFAWGSRG